MAICFSSARNLYKTINTKNTETDGENILEMFILFWQPDRSDIKVCALLIEFIWLKMFFRF